MDDAHPGLEVCPEPVYHPVRGQDAPAVEKSRLHKIPDTLELGHALLHEPGVMHRDRALNGEALSRNPAEFEADKFATFFLMPSKLVRSTFRKYFLLTEAFILNDGTAAALGPKEREEIRKGNLTVRQLARVLAGAEEYNLRHFKSLAQQFKVSNEAMAIRLEELELIKL